MKTLCLIAMMAVTAGTTARAQSNTNATLHMLRLTDIYSDSADFGGNGHTVTNRGNVRVIASGMKMTCALLITELPESGGRLSHIVAETNVVIDMMDPKGQSVHATGDKAVYNYKVENGVTNDTVTLTGNPQPRVEDAQGTQTADVIIWDHANNAFHFNGNFLFKPKLNGAPAGTNATPATTNELSAQITNTLPGTNENIDRMNIPTHSRPGF